MKEESEILEPVHKCLRELLELEKQNKASSVVYTDKDVVAAALLFGHIMGNRLYHRLVEEHVSIGLSQDLASNYGESIRLLTKQMSGVNIGSVDSKK